MTPPHDPQLQALIAVMERMRPHLEDCEALRRPTWRPLICTCGFQAAQDALMRTPAFATAVPWDGA